MRENRNRRFVATIQPIAHEKLYPIHSPPSEKTEGGICFWGITENQILQVRNGDEKDTGFARYKRIHCDYADSTGSRYNDSPTKRQIMKKMM